MAGSFRDIQSTDTHLMCSGGAARAVAWRVGGLDKVLLASAFNDDLNMARLGERAEVSDDPATVEVDAVFESGGRYVATRAFAAVNAAVVQDPRDGDHGHHDSRPKHQQPQLGEIGRGGQHAAPTPEEEHPAGNDGQPVRQATPATQAGAARRGYAPGREHLERRQRDRRRG